MTKSYDAKIDCGCREETYPSDVEAQVLENMNLYGTAFVRKTWDTQTGKVEWQVVSPSDYAKTVADETLKTNS